MNTKDILETLTGADILAKIHPSARKGQISSAVRSPGNIGDPIIESRREFYVDGKTYIVCVAVKE